MEKKESTEMSTEDVAKTLAEKATSQMRHSKKVYGDYTPEKREITSKIVENALENLNLAISRPKCAYGDLVTAQQRTQEYLRSCMNHQFIPTIEGWAIALGVGRRVLYKWFNGQNVHQSKEFNEFLAMTRDVIMSVMSQSAFNRNVDTVWSIFYGKNFYDMSDRTKISVAPVASPLGDTASAEELEKKYLEDVVGSKDEPLRESSGLDM